MTGSNEVNKEEAIRQVIAAGGSMDYVDVVNAVEKQFGIHVSSALVEQVHHQLSEQTRHETSKSRLDISFSAAPFTSQMPSSEPSRESPTRNQPGQAEASEEELAVALRFVKSVGGLSNARRLLDELANL
jgi:hypothetical protein